MFSNVAVIPSTESVGSLGDQILLKGLIDSNNNRCNYTLLLNDTTPNTWNFLVDYPYKYSGLQITENVFDMVFAIGADCIDGKYSTIFLQKVLYINKKFPELPIRIVSCSYNKTPSDQSIEIIKLFNKNVSFYFRDKFSKDRFDKRFDLETKLMSDLGFALKKNNYQFNVSDNSILVNLNNMSKMGYDYLPIINNKLRGRECVLLQHDYRGGHNEKDLLSNLRGRLIEETNVNDLRNLYDNIKLTISARLHICIMTLLAGKPVIGLNYQDKMEGVFYDLDILDLVSYDPNDFNIKYYNLVSDYDQIKKKIEDNLPRVIEKNWNYLARLGYKFL